MSLNKYLHRQFIKLKSHLVQVDTHMVKFDKDKDVIAFKNILGRLETEVGTMKEVIDQQWLGGRKENSFGRGHFPYWSFIRMLLPVAESVGALLYSHESTVDNLISVLENEFSELDSNYGKFCHLVVMLYRHPLIHTDELRGVVVNKTRIWWSMDASNLMKHMKVIKRDKSKSTYWIHFNPKQFYEHLVVVLKRLIERAEAGTWNGKIAERYASWTGLNLNQWKQFGVSKKSYEAIRGKEIKALRKASKDGVYPD